MISEKKIPLQINFDEMGKSDFREKKKISPPTTFVRSVGGKQESQEFLGPCRRSAKNHLIMRHISASCLHDTCIISASFLYVDNSLVKARSTYISFPWFQFDKTFSWSFFWTGSYRWKKMAQRHENMTT